MKEVEGSRNL